MAGRGGRGGRGRGGSTFGRGSKATIGGQEVGWDYDPELQSTVEAMFRPEGLSPPMEIPKMNPLTKDEESRIDIWLDIRDRIQKGPHYTVQPKGFRVSKNRQPAKARFDPFEGMRPYSYKYKQPQRALADFTTRSYRKSPLPARSMMTRLLTRVAATWLWPPELRSVVEQKPSKQASGRAKAKRARTMDEKLRDLPNEDEDDEENAEAGDEGRDLDDEAQEQEDADTDFSEDEESDMAGDYNAEAYFDGGDDDEVEAEVGDDGGDYE